VHDHVASFVERADHDLGRSLLHAADRSGARWWMPTRPLSRWLNCAFCVRPQVVLASARGALRSSSSSELETLPDVTSKCRSIAR
jgi:hypothetical protein